MVPANALPKKTFHTSDETAKQRARHPAQERPVPDSHLINQDAINPWRTGLRNTLPAPSSEQRPAPSDGVLDSRGPRLQTPDNTPEGMGGFRSFPWGKILARPLYAQEGPLEWRPGGSIRQDQSWSSTRRIATVTGRWSLRSLRNSAGGFQWRSPVCTFATEAVTSSPTRPLPGRSAVGYEVS